MSVDILVVGDGVLAELVSEHLSKDYRVWQSENMESATSGADLALLLHDAYDPALHLQAEKHFRKANIPWLRGFVSFGEAIVGPLVRSGQTGCSQCADMRRLMAGRDRKEMWKVQHMLREKGGIPRDPWSSRSGLLQVAYHVSAEVERIVEGRQAQLSEHIQFIDLQTLTSTRHFFLPNPVCPVCNQLPEDSEEQARIRLKPIVKQSPDSYRTKSIASLKQALTNEYLDSRTGFLNGKVRDLVSVFADVSVNLPLFSHDEGTAGRSVSYADSEITAILEGMERYCGLMPRGKRTMVRDCYANLAPHALDPTTAGTHSEEQYALPDFPFQPFDPKREMNWVWGYSFKEERPILVPELMAYYSMGFGEGVVFETSNGCALGGSLEEAIFYGILEVVERDAFLLTWYAQLPLPRLDPATVNDQELLLLIDRMQTVTNYDLYLFDATMENGIPAVWTIAKNRGEEGLHLVCAAGAHPDPIRAVKSSIYETAAMLMTLTDKYETNRDKYLHMLHDSSLVKKMDDHAMLYSLPEAAGRLSFLMDNSRPMVSFAEQFPRRNQHRDLTDDLRELLGVFQKVDLDVIVVDQTTPEVGRHGLSCVRVLIPGMLPMTFGQHLTRVTGLKRVLEVPVKLGYTKQPLRVDELNPFPHPFP
ncbi:TOMM precursor leader peptide-binding protein [Brevibacillus sp. NPDC058079]|uniref:TOMM precursor leader peptide-binding protein n=1 Tax=Brevibacillus sp. NPDC058079 TaxID=3346330 RepID=UPI0036ED4643